MSRGIVELILKSALPSRDTQDNECDPHFVRKISREFKMRGTSSKLNASTQMYPKIPKLLHPLFLKCAVTVRWHYSNTTPRYLGDLIII